MKDVEQTNEISLARKLSRMGMLISRYYHVHAREHGEALNALRGQGRVLTLLLAKPETSQKELSFVLDMRQQSLSELLAKLEEKGYVTRERSSADGRVLLVKLTEEGAKAASRVSEDYPQLDALDVLDNDERTQLEALTDKLSASLEDKLRSLGIDPNAPRHRDPHAKGHKLRRAPHTVGDEPLRAPLPYDPTRDEPIRHA